MSAAGLRTAITTVLQTYTGNPPIYAENTTIPTAAQGSPWVRWSLRMADAFDAEVGAYTERIIGTLYFQHFMPEGQGTKEAWDFCDKVGALLNRKAVAFGVGGRVIFERAVCQFIGAIDGNVQHNITIGWKEDAKALNAA